MYKIYRTGNIFIDIGLIRLHELIPQSTLNRNNLLISKEVFSSIGVEILKKLDEKKQENIDNADSKIQNIKQSISALESKVNSETNQNKKAKIQQQLEKKLKQLEKEADSKAKRAKQSYASQVKAFLNNNAMFGQPTTVDDELFKENLNLLVEHSKCTLDNDVQGETCDFCFIFKAPEKTSFFKRDQKSKKIVLVEKEREITNAIYPLLGAEAGGSGLNSFFPDGKSKLRMCYVCELLTFINSYNPPLLSKII